MNWLQKYRERRARGEKGFTLIELLLVIVILGVLAAVVVISVRGVNDRGEESACNATQTAVKTANEAFYAQNGSFPGTTDALLPNFLAEGAGADVTGNTVTGKGWQFNFDPATSTVSGVTGCDGSGGGGGGTTTTTPGGGGTTTTTPGGGGTTTTTTTTAPLVCTVTNITGITQTLESDGDLPSFTINATTANCTGTLLVTVDGPGTQNNISVNLGSPVPFGQREDWDENGTFPGSISGGGLPAPVSFDFIVQDPPCTVTSVSPGNVDREFVNNFGSSNDYFRLDSSDFPIISGDRAFDIDTQNCGGVTLTLHVAGRSLSVTGGGSGRAADITDSFRGNSASTSWTACGSQTITFTRSGGAAVPTSGSETLNVDCS